MAGSLQRGLSKRNASVPETGLIQVRIGINLGEVIAICAYASLIRLDFDRRF